MNCLNCYSMAAKVTSSDNIISCANALLDFVQQARKEGNAQELLNYLYEANRVALAFGPYGPFGNSNGYCVLEGSQAVNAFLSASMPRNTGTATYTLSAIEAYVQKLLSDFSAPATTVISPDRVTSILEHLNAQYDFSAKVFQGRIARFLILNSTQKDMNSAFAVLGHPPSISHMFLLYANRAASKDHAPEFVLFHELGHALHLHLTGDLDVLPAKLIKALDEICFPGLAAAPVGDQEEVLADVLAVGLMRGTPFEQYNYLGDHLPDALKDLFSDVVQQILSKPSAINCNPSTTS